MTNCDGKGQPGENHQFDGHRSCNQVSSAKDSPCSQTYCSVRGGYGSVNSQCNSQSSECWPRAELVSAPGAVMTKGRAGGVKGSFSGSGKSHYIFQLHSSDYNNQLWGLQWFGPSEGNKLACYQGQSCSFTGGNIQFDYTGNRQITVKVNDALCCQSNAAYDDAFTVHIGAYVGWNTTSSCSSVWSNLQYY